MAGSLNSAQVIGNLTRDPELKTTDGGTQFCKFGVATNRKWKDKDGKVVEQVEFHNVIAWGKLAEIINQYQRKGSKIYIQGRLQTQSWEDKESGKKMYRTEIVAENMIMLGGGNKSNDNVTNPAQEGSEAGKVTNTPPKEEELKIDDLPF